MLSFLPSATYLGYTTTLFMIGAIVVWLKGSYEDEVRPWETASFWLFVAMTPLCGIGTFLLSRAEAKFEALPVQPSSSPSVSIDILLTLAIVLVYLTIATIRVLLQHRWNASCCLVVLVIGASGPMARADYLYFHYDVFATLAELA